jgi:hypothetical protein
MSLALNNKVVTSGPTFTSLNEFVRHLGSDDVHAAAYGVGCQLNLSAPTHPLQLSNTVRDFEDDAVGDSNEGRSGGAVQSETL